jgi:hypothetical protein
MSFRFSTKKIRVESVNGDCGRCGHAYPMFRNTTTSDGGPSLECKQCAEVVVFTVWAVPNVQELEKEHGPKAALKIVEDQLPPCRGCGGKLVFSDAFDAGFPKKCPKCGNQQPPKKFSNAVLVEKEMALLGHQKDT